MRTFLELKRISHSSSNMRPHIAYTINHANAGGFYDFYGHVSEKHGIDISEISFAVEHPFGYYFKNNPAVSQETMATFKKQALYDIQIIRDLRHRRKLNYSNPLNLFYDYYLRNVSTYFMNPMQQIIPCRACEFSAFIDPYGDVYACTMWNEMLGNLKERSFRSVWESPLRQTARQIVRTGRCPNCWTPCEAQPSWFFNLGLARGWW